MSADREGAVRVAKKLRAAGFDAWFAGGCVRDSLLGRPAKDWDIATDARPEQVQALFRRTLAVGAAFGVIQVLERGGLQYEVATYRADGEYEDGRRPSEVHYSTSRVEDVKRRDFTLNALLMDPESGAIEDHVGGRADLEAGLIRAVGEARTRFREDRLRMLRALRFCTRLGFAIEPQTWAALEEEASHLGVVSPERITQEMQEILAGPRPGEAVRLMDASGLDATCLPERRPSDLAERLDRLPAAGAALSPEQRAMVGWALVMDEVPEAELEAQLRDRRASRVTMRTVRALRDAARTVADARTEPPEGALLAVARSADCGLVVVYLDCARPALAAQLRAAATWLGAHPPAMEALLDGRDLKHLGLAAGPAFKRILQGVEYAILEGRITTREAAEGFARELSEDSGG